MKFLGCFSLNWRTTSKACASAAVKLSCRHGSDSYGYPAKCAVAVPSGKVISLSIAYWYWTDRSQFLGQSESAKNDCLNPADSVETYPYSNLILLMICLISWAYLAAPQELKWSPSDLKSSRETLCFNRYQKGRLFTSWAISHIRHLSYGWALACHNDEEEGTWLQVFVASCARHCQWSGKFL